ncbi:hypothetical protein QTP88_011584 [Uroleucon formosanum]
MPQLCFICKKNTENITNFVVTSKRLETWGNVFQGLSVGQRICEKHFSSADIVREKIVKDSRGNILIRENYKHPIIKQGAVPCTNHLFSSVRELHRDTDDDILATPLVTDGMKQYTNTRLANSSSDYTLSVHKNEIPTPTANVFDKVYYDANSVAMPPNWSKILPANKKIVIFSKILINKESMYLNKVFKNNILLEKSNFTKSIDGIQNRIKKFDSIDMCKGIIKKKLKNRLSEFRTNFQVLQNKFKNLQEDSIFQQLMQYNISSNQQLLIKEIVYIEECIVLCILLHIRSPSSYSFMRDNQLLSLPCTRTMTNYLSIIKSSCGFDKNFFELFAKHLESKKDFQKHVNTTTLKYSGLIDFGDEEGLDDLPKAKCLKDKATHGIVFLFQPLANSYLQPIAVFASKGPVSGFTLAQLVIKAVVLLENAGAKVHGLVSDGAQTNIKVWMELDISGKLNNCRSHIEHFIDPNDGLIKWEHFELLHEHDKKICGSQLRVLSKSMSDGLKFYQKHNIPGLEPCDATIKFTKIMNDMFDALNAKCPFEGVRPGSKNFQDRNVYMCGCA